MRSRRTLARVAAASLLVPMWAGGAAAVPAPPPLSSPPLTKFTEQLPIPPVLDRRSSGAAGEPAQLTLDEVVATHRFHTLLQPTPTFAYSLSEPPSANTFLGPTIEVQRGTPLSMTVRNKLGDGTTVEHPLAEYFDSTLPGAQTLVDKTAVPTAVHLHGGHTPPDSDGGPDDTFYPRLALGAPQALVDKATTDFDTDDDGAVTYRYPNDQEAAGLWIHDHALGATRLNPKSGLAANYWIRDRYDTGDPGNPLGLPTGEYELPLVLQDGSFSADGTLTYPINTTEFHPVWAPESFGDVAIVNGKAWPNHDVKQGLYRLRFVNGSNARVYRLTLVDVKGQPAARVPVAQIGSDGGLLNAPAPLTGAPLLLAPGERADVLVDFSKAAPGAYRWVNSAPTPFPSGPRGNRPGASPLREIVQFTVTPQPGFIGTIPAQLRGGVGQPAALPAASPSGGATTRTMLLNEIIDPATGSPVEVLVNNQRFHKDHGTGHQAVAANPSLNTMEVWTLVNTTADTHPIHLHLTQFRVLGRQAFDSAAYLAKVSADIQAVEPNVLALPDPSAGGLGTGTTGTQYGEELVTAPDPTPYLRGAARAPALNELGWKDTAMSHPGEVLRLAVPFGGTAAGLSAAFTGDGRASATQSFVGQYVLHCHILEHEENDMMQAYRVVDRG